MASEWAQQRLRKWLDEVVDLNKRQIGFRIPELLDEVRKEIREELELEGKWTSKG